MLGVPLMIARLLRGKKSWTLNNVSVDLFVSIPVEEAKSAKKLKGFSFKPKDQGESSKQDASSEKASSQDAPTKSPIFDKVKKQLMSKRSNRLLPDPDKKLADYDEDMGEY